MRKVVLKLDLHDERTKQKAMKVVSGLLGVDSVSVDMNDEKLTVVGDVDTVTLTNKLRKLCHADVVSVGPSKEEKKEKDGGNKPDDMPDCIKAYYEGYHQALMMRAHSPFFTRGVWEEDPYSCVIL